MDSYAQADAHALCAHRQATTHNVPFPTHPNPPPPPPFSPPPSLPAQEMPLHADFQTTVES
jgi:hypothetical protein